MLRPLLALTVLLCSAVACTSVSAGSPRQAASSPRSTEAISSPGSTSPPSSPPRSSAPSMPHSTAAPRPSRTATPPRSAPERALASMSEAQRVGQLLMVDCPSTGVAAATVTAIQRYHVGSVILDGTSSEGAAAVRSVTGRLQALAPAAVRLLISTDQEGGLVQRLRGSGFSAIPSAVQQGTWSTSTLRTAAATWAQQLRAAGVNVNLAPVMDTVPPGDTDNPPIGDLDREYGHDPAAVTASGVAFLRGMAAGGVAATVKHFPGLGRVTGNTDTTAGVRDTVTGPDDPYLQPFQAAVRAGVPLVMMSTAIYSKIDPDQPAAFSSAIVTGILRHRFGYRGVVISDDLGGAKQVSGYPVGARAVDFIRAGGDLVLTVDAGQAAAMTAALLHEASVSSSFRSLVNASALRVLEAKSALGLLH